MEARSCVANLEGMAASRWWCSLKLSTSMARPRGGSSLNCYSTCMQYMATNMALDKDEEGQADHAVGGCNRLAE